MKKFCARTVLLGLLLFPAVCLGEPYVTTKIIPESVDYADIRTKLYPHKKEVFPRIQSTFETIFGVRRFLMFHTSERDLLEQTKSESQDTWAVYRAYGPLGSGEEIFTRQAAYIRAQSLRK
jgi:hypothetical protein